MSLLQDFPHLPKRRLELQKQYTPQQQQPPPPPEDDDNMICDDEPPFKKPRPGVATNLMYKLTELAAYTFGVSSEVYNIYNTITGGQGGKDNQRPPIRHSYYYDQYDDVLQIKADEDEENDLNDLNDHEFDKKDGHAWEENDEEEPPPPYESSWYMSAPEAKPPTTPGLSSSPSQESLEQLSTPEQIFTKSTTTIPPRRRQFRVRRGRRLLRRKSSSVDMKSNPNDESSTSAQPGDDDDIFLKFNCKLTDMIDEAKAALKSKAEVTEVDVMLAEEKEREERIMKEFGIQTPVNRRARRHTGSSSSTDYEYFSSILGSGHSNQSNTLLHDNGQNYHFSQTGYSADNGFLTNRLVGHSPTQYGSPGVFNPSSGYGYLGGSPSTGGYGNIPTTNRFNSSTGLYGGSSSGFHNFGQNSSGYGSNSGFASRGMYNSRGYY